MDIEDEEKDYYEYIQYRELLKLQPDDFYLHLPLQFPFLKWFFELRLQLMFYMGKHTNYFGMRHSLDPQVQWFSDWVFLNHYQFDYLNSKQWRPSLIDHIRYQWLTRQGYYKEQTNYPDLREIKND